MRKVRFKQGQTKIDDWISDATKIWGFIDMNKSLKKNLEKIDTKTFSTSFEIGNIPHSENIHGFIESTGWSVYSQTDSYNSDVNARFDFVSHGDSRFYNPTDANPMKASLFLNCHVIPDMVKQIIQNRYKNLEHYHKNPEAMLLTLVYQRIKCLRYFSRVERHLKDYDTDAELLGFIQEQNKKRHIPDKKTLGHFQNTRLGIKGMESIRDAYIVALKNELAKYNYELGAVVSIDSTPLTALSKDPEARYNKHYDRYMYKIHFIIDVGTNIPLFVIVTSGTAFDGKYLISILKKLHSLGLHPKELYADEHYDTLENWAVASLKYKVNCHINLAENAVYRDDGKPVHLQKEYQGFRRNIDFRPQDKISFDEMLQYLLEQDKYECVGSYFRNQWYLTWKKYKEELEKKGEKEKKPRAKSEGLHGHIKENMMFEMFMDGKGMKYAQKHANMYTISLLVVALTRVQHGVFDGLTKIACLT